VETFANIPYIYRPAVWPKYQAIGTEKNPKAPKCSRWPAKSKSRLGRSSDGTTLRELVFDIGGGIENGKKFKAIQTGGPSGAVWLKKIWTPRSTLTI
jgi:NADH:ubiquinone oxidoreductase subunit F (NADH-binding)